MPQSFVSCPISGLTTVEVRCEKCGSISFKIESITDKQPQFSVCPFCEADLKMTIAAVRAFRKALDDLRAVQKTCCLQFDSWTKTESEPRLVGTDVRPSTPTAK